MHTTPGLSHLGTVPGRSSAFRPGLEGRTGATLATRSWAPEPVAGPASHHRLMTAQQLVGSIEEMRDLKTQHYAEMNLKVTRELPRLLGERRETDQRRLQQSRRELSEAREG